MVARVGCLSVLLLLRGAMHVCNFHFASEMRIVSICLAGASIALMRGIETTRVTIPPVVVSLNWMGRVAALGIVGSTSSFAAVVASTVASSSIALIVVLRILLRRGRVLLILGRRGRWGVVALRRLG